MGLQHFANAASRYVGAQQLDRDLEELTTHAPGRAPDLADQAIQAAAAEGRMRIGMGRAATFLTGLGRSVDSGLSSGGSSRTLATRRDVDLFSTARRAIVDSRSRREPGDG